MYSESEERFHIGILCAMPEEIGCTLQHIKNKQYSYYGDLRICSGEWEGGGKNSKNIVLSVAWSGWGKVSASRAATRLLGTLYDGLKVRLLIFTGVAGGVAHDLKQWDLILTSQAVQHDMDARPMYEEFVIPALNSSILSAPNVWVDWAFKTLQDSKKQGDLHEFGDIRKCLVATGDSFISDKSVIKSLVEKLPDLGAVEMEGAAVAQVAEQEKIPWIILRVISDSADDSAAEEFSKFLVHYEKISWKLIENLLKNFNF